MKVLTITDVELEDIIERSVSKALDRLQSPDDKKLPARVSMRQAQVYLGVGRRKILNLVARGQLNLISRSNEKYKFNKSEVIQIKRNGNY